MIQIDMEKPKGCNVCPFAVPHKKLLGFYVCLVCGKKFGQLTSSLYKWHKDEYFLTCPIEEYNRATVVRCSFDRCIHCDPAEDGYLGICQRDEIILDDAVQEILCGCPDAEWEEVKDNESI